MNEGEGIWISDEDLQEAVFVARELAESVRSKKAADETGVKRIIINAAQKDQLLAKVVMAVSSFDWEANGLIPPNDAVDKLTTWADFVERNQH